MISASFAPLVAWCWPGWPGPMTSRQPTWGWSRRCVLLTLHGWLAGRAAQLRGWQLFLATSFAAALGLVMILLKDLVLTDLH